MFSVLCQLQQLAVAFHGTESGEVVRLICLHRAQGLLDHSDNRRRKLLQLRDVRPQDLRDEELRVNYLHVRQFTRLRNDPAQRTGAHFARFPLFLPKQRTYKYGRAVRVRWCAV